MMGMGSLAYWLSWYVYYTIISTVIVLLAWGVLMINCIVYSNPFLVFCFLAAAEPSTVVLLEERGDAASAAAREDEMV